MSEMNAIFRSVLAAALVATGAFAAGKPGPSAAASMGPYPEHGYPWENNSLGITDSVPKPWTELEYNGDRVRVWGREFDFGGGMMPRQIINQGKRLFAGPPRLTMVIDGKTLSDGGATKWVTRAGHMAVRRTTAQIARCRVEAVSSLEYDGFLRIDLTIEPLSPSVLTKLQMSFPLRRETASVFSHYLDYDFDRQWVDRHGVVKSFGTTDAPVSMKFYPTVWVGNQNVGMEWACETNAGWRPGDLNAAIRLTPSPDAVTLTVDVVSAKVQLDKPFTLSFALYPTPMKPLRKDWRRIQLVNAWETGDVITAQKYKVYGHIWHGKHFTLAYPGLPIVEPSKAKSAWPEGQPGTPEQQMADGLKRLRNLGIQTVPYTALYAMPARLPGGMWQHFAEAWRALSPRGFSRNKRWAKFLGIKSGEPSFYYICLSPKSIRDFLVWTYADAITRYGTGGLYYDVSQLNCSCRNPAHEHPAGGETGVVYQPLFWQRRLQQRVWVACKAINPDYFITAHSSKTPMVSAGFVDNVLSGEALNVCFRKPGASVAKMGSDPDLYVPDYSRLPDVLYETQYSQRHGFTNMLLPQVRRKWNEGVMRANPDLCRKYTRGLLARLVAYGIPARRSMLDEDLFDTMLKAYERFGGLGGTTFVAPWESSQFLERPTKPIKVSLYYRPGQPKALVCLANLTDAPAKTDLALNRRALESVGVRVSKTAKLIDAIRGDTIAAEGHGWPVALDDQDFRILLLE